MARPATAERPRRRRRRRPEEAPAALIRAEMKAGRATGLDADRTARALITMNRGCFFEQLIGRPRADPEPLVETLVEIWTRTIYGSPVPPDTVAPGDA